jgi:phytoene synthase
MSIEPNHPEHRLALGYAPAEARAGLAALLALDERLAEIVARPSEAAIRLMRLIWWRDALARLDTAPPPAEPLLVVLASLEISGVDLAAMIEGWEALIDDPDLADETVAIHAQARGAGMFRLAGTLLSADRSEIARLAQAGEGWARTDLARIAADPVRAGAILASARAPLRAAMAGPWPRRLRPIAQLAALGLDDVRRGIGRGRALASPLRLLRILYLQTTGR